MIGAHVLMGSSAMIRHVQHLVTKLADGNTSSILIMGEMGTGKEMVAKIIHSRTLASAENFLTIKCENIDEHLFEMQLLSCRGSVYLDEIGKLSEPCQMLVLGAIHNGTRIIAATCLNLEQLMRQQEFCEELFYKLSGSSLYLPSLRERKEDIPILAEHFLQTFNQLKFKKLTGISYDVMHAFLQHDWKYNLVELENLMERLVILKNRGMIEVCDLPPKLRCLVTDNINDFYDKQLESLSHSKNFDPEHSANYIVKSSHKTKSNSFYQIQDLLCHKEEHLSGEYMRTSLSKNAGMSDAGKITPNSIFNEMSNEIDQFIKNEIDLGAGIDFYRVVEEFENKLISEALRRTNHNKNRASQLLSMNRTTLVEKLKKRAFHSTLKDGSSVKTKKNQSFTIFDELGGENPAIDGIDFIQIDEVT